MNLKPLGKRRFQGASVQPVVLPDPISTFMPGMNRQHYALFWGMLVGGLIGLIALTVAVVDTHSARLEKVFVVLGSLFVPSLYVYYLDMRSLFVDPRWRTLLATFLLGAFVSTTVATVLEFIVPITMTLGGTIRIGVIEEGSKAIALLWLLRRSHRNLHFEMDGIILGAAAGMGFAAVEDMVYGASVFSHGLNQVIDTVWLRQILGPFGHGTWTGIVGGAIWRAKGAGSPRITPGVVAAFIVAALLHAFWDWGGPFGRDGTLFWMLGVGVAGLLILRAMVHQALEQERAFTAAEHNGDLPEPSA